MAFLLVFLFIVLLLSLLSVLHYKEIGLLCFENTYLNFYPARLGIYSSLVGFSVVYLTRRFTTEFL